MPAATKTQICNMALGHIGINGRIQNVDTETSREATTCDLYFDRAVAFILEAQVWDFAAEQSSLVLVTAVEHDEWCFQYKYPNFVARVNYILNPLDRRPAVEQKVPFRIVNIPTSLSDTGKLILSDQADAKIDFNRKIIEVSLFSETFVQALAYFLASQIGGPLRVTDTLIDKAETKAIGLISEAVSQTFAEQQEDPERRSEFETSRL